MQNTYEAIKADHERHRALMNKIADTSGASDERSKASRVFYDDVTAHAAAE
jgi:hypothetical protein